MKIPIVCIACLAVLGRAAVAGAQPTPPPTPAQVAPPFDLTLPPGLLAASIKPPAARDATDDLQQKPPSGRRGAGVRGLSEAERRQVALPGHDHQRRLRGRESDTRPGHRENHAQDVVGEHGERLGLGPGRLQGQPDRPPLPRQQLLHGRSRQWPELLRVGGRDRVR